MKAITLELKIAGVLTAGQAANITFRKSPYADPGDVISGLTVTDTLFGTYKVTGFTTWNDDTKAYLSGVEISSFGIKPTGSVFTNFLNKFSSVAQTVLSRVDFTNGSGIKTDLIAGYSGATDLTLCGITIISGMLSKTAFIQTDTIAEKTAANGVTIDGVNLKDNIYTGHTGRALLAEPNILIVDSKRATDLTAYVYNDLDTALTYAAANASVLSRYNILIVPHIGSTYSVSQAFPDYVNIYGIGGMVPIVGAFTRSGSVALSAIYENVYFQVSDGNHIIVRSIARNCAWQTLVDALDGGTITLTSSHLTNCGLYGFYDNVGDEITSGGTNKLVGCYGNFNVAWAGTDEVYGYDYIAGDGFSY